VRSRLGSRRTLSLCRTPKIKAIPRFSLGGFLETPLPAPQGVVPKKPKALIDVCFSVQTVEVGLDFLTAPDADPEALAAINAALEDRSGGEREINCCRKDGSTFWASVSFSPIRDHNGTIVQHFLSFIDLTKHKREAARLRFLLAELNHRTQNTLATVLAIASQTLGGALAETVVDLFEGRVLALSKAQSLLGRVNWVDVSLRDVIEQILEPFGLLGSLAASKALPGLSAGCFGGSR
jgi:HWE histidine kinase/PAS domain